MDAPERRALRRSDGRPTGRKGHVSLHAVVVVGGLALLVVALTGRALSWQRSWVRLIRAFDDPAAERRRELATEVVSRGLTRRPKSLRRLVATERDDLVLDLVAKEVLGSRLHHAHAKGVMGIYVWAYRRAIERGFAPERPLARGDGSALHGWPARSR